MDIIILNVFPSRNVCPSSYKNSYPLLDAASLIGAKYGWADASFADNRS